MRRPKAVRPVKVKDRRGEWHARVTWAMVVIGALLFVLGYVGATTGLTILPFDRHHVFTQILGGAVALVGLTRIGARPGTKSGATKQRR